MHIVGAQAVTVID